MTIESEQNKENSKTVDLDRDESPAQTVLDEVFGRGLSIVAALNLLRIRLLDLTKNNRLLNFKHTAGKSLQFIESSPEAVYRKLVENSTAKLKLVPVPEPARDEWAERNGRMARPDVVEYAKLRGIDVSLELSSQSEESPSALQTLLYPEDLERHARKLAGEGQSAIEETGANMLYLVFGFIEYPQHEGSDKNLIAPLISMPAALERGEREDSSGHYRYYLKASGEDVTENLSLRERLKQDFSLNLPDWNEELTPNLYFAAIEELIRNKPGWRLRRQLTVGLLSFSKMLLFRDLDPDNWPQDSTGLSKLLDHSVVRLMIEGREGGERNEIAVLGGPPEYAIDEHKERDLPLIYDADSSQHSALIDALEGQSIVIKGPPGTGKSQTITNLIANTITQGRKVLFVSEKMAALNVVKSRLTHAGLGDFCLELHSNKTQKKTVLDALENRLGGSYQVPPGLSGQLRALEEKRDTLKTYVEIMKSRVGNAQELTVHQVFWKAERARQQCGSDWRNSLDITVPSAREMVSAAQESMRSLLSQVAQQYLRIANYGPSHPFWGLYPLEFTPSTERAIEAVLKECFSKLEELAKWHMQAAAHFGTSELELDAERARALEGVLRAVQNARTVEPAYELLNVLFGPDERKSLRCAQVLKGFSEKLAKVATLRQKVQGKLSEQSKASPVSEAIARELGIQAKALRLDTQSVAQVRELVEQLEFDALNLEETLKALSRIGEMTGALFRHDDKSVNQLCAIVEIAATSPRHLLHHRHSGIGRPDALEILERARAQWSVLAEQQQILNGMFYMDSLPEESVLVEALTVLREGDTWYRVFQKQWRAANSVHHRLLREKVKLSGSARGQELERLLAHERSKRKWGSDSQYKEVLGPMYRGEDSLLDEAYELAKWRADAHQRMLAVGFDSDAFDWLNVESETLVGMGNLRSEIKKCVQTLERIRHWMVDKFQVTSEDRWDAAESEVWMKRRRSVEDIARSVRQFERELSVRLVDECTVIEGCEALLAQATLVSAAQAVEVDSEAAGILGERFRGIDTDLSPVRDAYAFGKRFTSLDVPLEVKAHLLSERSRDAQIALISLCKSVQEIWPSVERFVARMSQFGRFDLAAWAGKAPGLPGFSKGLAARTQLAAERLDTLLPWTQFHQAVERCEKYNLAAFVHLLQERKVSPEHLSNVFDYRFYASIAQALFERHPTLAQFGGATHDQVRREFVKLEKDILNLRGKDCAAKAAACAKPLQGKSGARVDDRTEMALLQFLMPQRRPRVPIRKMMSRAGRSIQALKPCFMMGPQAVAQFLEADKLDFDLVIMDEASQLRPEEALGAIARGKQVVVVGDPNQLPPTTFFDRFNVTTASEEAQESTIVSQSSILDVCIGNMPVVRELRWHYRSRHQSLIAFSNARFYKNLVVFPAPYAKSTRLGVQYEYIANAVYENKMNRIEADRVVDAIVEHMLERKQVSLGVVTLNLQQKDLIDELLERRLKRVPDAEDYRRAWMQTQEPFFIKNLENVQGDERDAIFISTTFGRAPNTEVVRQTFGPISQELGWRRLNVLFTRAKELVRVFSSMRPEDIVLDAGTPRGTKELRNYLQYASTGIIDNSSLTGRPSESDFELAVIAVLHEAGYKCEPQFGVAGFRIDIAVEHPQYTGTFMAAIECDGATYHSGVSVRDRDRIRQEILESLGWKGRIWRIWSTDWFRAPESETARLFQFLKDLEAKPFEYARLEPSVDARVDAAATDVAMPVVPLQRSQTPRTVERAEQLELVIDDSDRDLEVNVGDVVTYAAAGKPKDDIIVRISNYQTKLEEGFIAQATPLAQTLLGATAGEEVVLRVPGKTPQRFVVKKIVRPAQHET